MKNEFEKLKIALYNMSKPSCDASSKERIKKAVFSGIKNNLIAEESALRKIHAAIKNLAQKVVPSAETAARIKERVLTFVEKHSTGPSLFWKITWNVEKVFAGLILFTMVSGITLMYIVDIPVTKAAKRTLVQEVAGDVKILRGDQILKATSGMSLNEGDSIVTGDGSVAEIRYFDDSITRISPSSQIKIQKLFKDSKSSTKTQIDLDLINGRVWSQVVNLVDSDASFNVNTPELQTTAQGKASFDIKNIENSKRTEVSVFKNKVKVSLPKSTEDKSKMILEGYSLEVNNEQPEIEKLVIKPEISEEETWVKGNIEKDKEYVAQVTAEVKESGRQEAGVMPDNPLYTAKKLNEGTKLLVTGDENEKIKLQIDNAKTRLLEANAYFADGKKEEGQKLLDEFDAVVSEISETIKSSEDLKAYAQSQFAEESKKLAVILPDSDLYPAKEALRDAKMLLAINAEEQKAVAFEHASEKILEAKDLVNENKNDIAVATLENIKDDVKTGIGASEDAADTLATAKVLTDTVQDSIAGDNINDTRKLNKIVTETEAALNTEFMQAAVTEEIETPIVDNIMPTPSTTQIEVISNPGDSDIAVIIPVESEEQE